MRWLDVLRRAAARTRLVVVAALVLLSVLPGAWAGRALADVPPAPNVGAQAGRLAWPLTPRPKVTRFFEPPATVYGPGHRGVDLEAAAGQQVLAADMGVVIFAGEVGGHGVVAVDHDGGLRTTYLPVTPGVATGDQVYRGQPLGTVAAGHPGCPTATCLHWGARKGEEYIDPLALVGVPGRVRLKPWADPP
ncbi:M23 family metallopeptidase [Amycolatopsis carbonis]|uniref:M23 family metallopeptidase n=1 Tax=Amycolatopsis carbonis TaxID=715471 RepID=A0A9Y2MXF6_9PSEU|nr:M23 family metallopeptidase [Amycolatopsis sp. 2-15]WIX78777.1 M23 family metallopeptidase [Amycolatopsis sp. 2-15]